MNEESKWKGNATTRTWVYLGWWDRIRVLFGGVVVSVSTPMTEDVEFGPSVSRTYVEPPRWWPKRKPQGETSVLLESASRDLT